VRPPLPLSLSRSSPSSALTQLTRRPLSPSLLSPAVADFGVATRVGSLPDSSVVGSPYWMAPEVVDQSGASPSSDIWSLGALVVELLTGKPPYHHLDPMPALFRIVNDPDGPPLPPGASAGVRDFLAQCFQKDGNLRVGARKLLRHPWMVAAKRQADAQREESDARAAAARGPGAGAASARGARAASTARGGEEERDEARNGAPRPASTYEDEVRVVKEWNEALRGASALPSFGVSSSCSYGTAWLIVEAPAAHSQPRRTSRTDRAPRPSASPPPSRRRSARPSSSAFDIDLSTTLLDLDFAVDRAEPRRALARERAPPPLVLLLERRARTPRARLLFLVAPLARPRQHRHSSRRRRPRARHRQRQLGQRLRGRHLGRQDPRRRGVARRVRVGERGVGAGGVV